MHPKYSLLVVVPVVMVSCSIATGAVNPVYNESNTFECLVRYEDQPPVIETCKFESSEGQWVRQD